MDPKLLADALTTFLAPAMPYLIHGGEKAVGEVGKKIGEDGLEIAKKLWAKLRPKAEASPRVKEAAEEVAVAPEDGDAQAALRLQIRKILEADPALAAELARLVEAAGPRTTYQATVYGKGAIAQGKGAVAAGAGGVAVGGSVKGDVRVGGAQPHSPRGPQSDD